jgi:Zn-dependent membrane protease YugP
MIIGPSIVILIPAILLTIYAQIKVKSTFAKFQKVATRRGMSGAEVAAAILRDAEIVHCDDPVNYPGQACALEAVQGRLTDHYDPQTRTLRLSQDVYYGTNVAALGVAAHEVGHAIQHARSYTPLMMRSAMYPMASLGSNLGFILFFAGFFFGPTLLWLGITFYTAAVLFTVVTLPVEFNASSRALKALAHGGYLEDDELLGARKVLNAAALTYVAAASMAILELIRMFLIARD